MKPPLPNSYWVIEGRLLAGEHPCGADESAARERLLQLHAAGIDYFVDLTEADERPSYRALLPRDCDYLRSAIVDTLVPTTVVQMQELQIQIRNALTRGRGVYVHCRAGIGRTGVAIGCYLVETGLDGKSALKQLNRLWRESERSKFWPEVPQTTEQADYIRQWPRHRTSDGRGDPRRSGDRSGVIGWITGMNQRIRSAGRRKV